MCRRTLLLALPIGLDGRLPARAAEGLSAEEAVRRMKVPDGRALTGLLVEESPGGITLVDARGQRTVLPRGRIESTEEPAVSLMPENVLQGLRPAELRDLFAYLQADRPPLP